MNIEDIKENGRRLIHKRAKTVEDLESNITDMRNLYKIGLGVLSKTSDAACTDEEHSLGVFLHSDLRQALNRNYEALYNAYQ